MRNHYWVLCPAASLSTARSRLQRNGQGAGNFPLQLVRTTDRDDASAKFYAAGINPKLLAEWQRILSGLPVVYVKGNLHKARWYEGHAQSRGLKRRLQRVN